MKAYDNSTKSDNTNDTGRDSLGRFIPSKTGRRPGVHYIASAICGGCGQAADTEPFPVYSHRDPAPWGLLPAGWIWSDVGPLCPKHQIGVVDVDGSVPLVKS